MTLAKNRIWVALLLSVVLLSAHRESPAMDTKQALVLTQHWGRSARDARFIQQLKVGSDGSFVTKGAGAFLRYDAGKRRLLVSGLVGYNMAAMASDMEFLDRLHRAGEREKVTLGEGRFEIYERHLFDMAPDVVLLTKDFVDGAVAPEQFAREVRWLLAAAHHWQFSAPIAR
jgi:hypothetical protein